MIVARERQKPSLTSSCDPSSNILPQFRRFSRSDERFQAALRAMSERIALREIGETFVLLRCRSFAPTLSGDLPDAIFAPRADVAQRA